MAETRNQPVSQSEIDMGSDRIKYENVDHLILVVHGVGDPMPGETVSLFARSVACEQRPLNERQEVVWLAERSDDHLNVKTYASHLRFLEFGNQRTLLSEVFWGDLSYVRKGALGALIGLVEILFGLRFVAYVAGSQPGFFSRGLQRLGAACFSILHGPVLAVTFFLALLTGALIGTELMWRESSIGLLWGTILTVGCCIVAISASQLGSHLTRNPEVHNFWQWVWTVALFISILLLVKLFFLDARFPELTGRGAARPGLIWYCQVLVILLALLWVVEMLIIIAMAVCWLGAVLRPGAHRTVLNVAFLIPALIVGFWGFVLPMMWLTAAKSLREFVALDKFEELFRQAVPLLGVQFLMVLIGLGAMVFALVRYALWRVRMAKSDLTNVGEPPRLIIHPVMQTVLAIVTVVGVTFVGTITLSQYIGWDHQFLLRQLAEEANSYATGILIPLGFLLAMVFPRLRPVLDIVLDVTNHFYFRPTRMEDTVFDSGYDIREATFEQNRLYFSRRDAIFLRIKRLLGYMRDQMKGRPKLSIISHSQGTVIAAEVLNDPDLNWLNSSFSEVRLVTMGSPLTHLYQHYFRNAYPPLSDPFWEMLRGRVDRWVNIFRMDDFVGTRIDFPDRHECCGPASSNHVVGARGHLNYWTDIHVLEIVRNELSLEQPESVPLRHAA